MFFIISLERCQGGAPWYWRPNRWGYTQSLEGAGKYNWTEAYEICKASGGMDVPVPIGIALAIEPNSVGAANEAL